MVPVELVAANKFWRLFFRVTGFGAITLPGRKIVMLEHHIDDEQTINHELVHVEQYERMGTRRFLIRYAWSLIRHGYHKSKFEVEARENENRK